MTDYAEAHISTEQPSARQNTRISSSHGDQERPSGAEETTREGPQKADSDPLLIQAGRLSRSTRLRSSGEFRLVYASGKRYDGHLMTAFIRHNGLNHHRLGITASRKVARRAVDRNRLKRLLREAFRLSGPVLDDLQINYDWVLNAKRSLLKVKVTAPLEDFHKLIARVKSDERNALVGTGQYEP